MTIARRQLTDFRRLRQAQAAAADRIVLHDRPTAYPEVLRQGVARIAQNDGGGLYTIWEQHWDSQANQGQGGWVDAVGGYRERTARDFDSRASGRVGALVRFWEQYARPDSQGGCLEVLLDIGDIGVFWARIGASQAAGSNQWLYAWTEVQKTAAGYGGWSAGGGGRSDAGMTLPGRNSVEDANTGQDGHIEGNGVDPANLASDRYSFELQPCPSGCLVRMHEVRFLLQGQDTMEYWFAYENGVDGGCL